jgi:hypothetical protein
VFCNKCATLFFNGFESNGVCAGGAGGHDGNPSLPYLLLHGETQHPNQLGGFRFCANCFSLYLQKDVDPFHGDGSTQGVCAAGGGHGGDSFAYLVDRDVHQPHGERLWAVCHNCNCVHHTPQGERACAGSGDALIGHDAGDAIDPPLLVMRFGGD